MQNLNVKHFKGIDMKRLFNTLNAELNPVRHFMALVGAHHIVHVSRVRVKYPNRDWLLALTCHCRVGLQNVTMKYEFRSRMGQLRYILCTRN